MPRRGENIYKRKDGRWEGRYIKQYIDGKAKYGYIYAKTYKELKEKMNRIDFLFTKENTLSKESPSSTMQVTFGVIAEEWLVSLKPNLKESSIVKYNNLLNNYLFPKYENLSIYSITQEDIADFLNEIFHTGGKKGTGLSSKTITSIFSVIKSVFEYAQKSKKLNIADISKINIKQTQKSLRILSISEQKKLNEYLKHNMDLINLGILLCLYTGIRIGEVCALKWEDISFEEQYLYVHKTMQRIQNLNNEGPKTSISITKPKSECSIRRIPIPNEVFRILVALKGPQNAFILSGETYSFIEPRTMQYRFKVIIKKCNIEDANFHSLRHTFATRCVELGFDYKSLSEILGHATVNITLNRYVHPSMELKQKNMNMLSELFAVK